VNLYWLVKEVEDGKRETIIVHLPFEVKDTESYAMQNDPMRMFWNSCVRLEVDEVL